MGSDKDILASNALMDDATAPRVTVFVGGISGIRKFTLRALVATVATMKIYLVGRRSFEKRMHDFIQELHVINPKAEVIWTEGEIALFAETKRVCKTIESEAEDPKVSVLGGGLEREIKVLDGLDLKKPGSFGSIKAQMQYTTMNTLTLEKLANDNPNVTFIHSWPGTVNIGNSKRGNPNAIMSWFISLVPVPLISLIRLATSCLHKGICSKAPAPLLAVVAFHGKGSQCECTPNAKAMRLLREGALEKDWDHAQEVFPPYL
ncbi:hypothetical protein INT43_002123 [Umbelopsis isabellina]|uniref:Uncharacterized protein n=1 Tax=Mortierella isabellina TaxID=91625 RepID=A0A8H7UGQ9_MORIS|nr:hypothetical protein INT43_002123 [Umbelopsis isabellina]